MFRPGKHGWRWLVVAAFLPAALGAVCGERELTSEQVKVLIPLVQKLHLSRPQNDAVHLKRLLKMFMDQLDPAHSLYLKDEAAAKLTLGEEEQKKLARNLLSGDQANKYWKNTPSPPAQRTRGFDPSSPTTRSSRAAAPHQA